MKFPPYYGWSHYMSKKPGEDATVFVRRVFVWDALTEGEIKFY